MRKLLLLSVVSMMATLLFASAAFAQQTGPEFCYDGTLDPNYPNCPFYPGIDDPNYQALAPAPTATDTAAPAPESAPISTTAPAPLVEAPEPTATTSEAYPALPDTGGPSLLLPISLFLVGTGILGLSRLRR